ATPPPRTQTLPDRAVFHDVQAAIRPLLAGVQTSEQVDDPVQSLQDLHRREQILDSPVISHKGRPGTVRLTNAREGRSQGS
ncbi:hypothetical protein DFH09DRAFT_828924, partial [Mycena vulgaris]